MSISTDVVVQHRLPDGATGGRFITFDADLMFSELRLDEHGALWERDCEPFIGEGGPPCERAFAYTGEMCLQRIGADNGTADECYAALFTRGRLDAIRPGWREAWSRTARAPDGDGVPLVMFPPLHGESRSARGFDEHRMVEVLGLDPAPVGLTWAVGTGGGLVRIRLGALEDDPRSAWREACAAHPQPVHGWVFTRNSDGVGRMGGPDDPGRLPEQAARFVSGRMQCLVRTDADGVANEPETLGELLPSPAADSRQASLRGACRVLPTDYADYGGEAVRWELPGDCDPDCSSGCRWFAPLHDPGRHGDDAPTRAAGAGADGDWGVCANPRSPRRGLLTWEHQAGRGCFEPDEHSGQKSAGCAFPGIG